MKLSVPIAYKEKISTKEEIFSFMAKDQEDVLVSIEDLENLKSIFFNTNYAKTLPKLRGAELDLEDGLAINFRKGIWKLDLASRALETKY